MWMLIPIFCLAIVHISANNVAVIPDLAEILSKEVYIATICTYIVLATLLAALTAWIGVTAGQDLVAITKALYGCHGKKVLAITLLSISIPASALTGGYYAAEILHIVFGMPLWATALCCLSFFSLLAVGYSHELLKMSNYIALLLIPVLVFVFLKQDWQFQAIVFGWNDIQWLLVFGLIGYNVGGMWSAFVVETAAYLSHKGSKGVLLIILAKVVEGFFTMCMAYVVLSSGLNGPFALVAVVYHVGGAALVYLFYIILFCIFTNTMAPAMLVNARQISSLTGLTFWPALLLAALIVYAVSFLSLALTLSIIGYTSIIMIVFIIYTAYLLHKFGLKQQ